MLNGLFLSPDSILSDIIDVIIDYVIICILAQSVAIIISLYSNSFVLLD